MTFNGVIGFILRYFAVTMVEDKPIMSTEYRLPVIIWPKVIHAAVAQSHCDSWASCLVDQIQYTALSSRAQDGHHMYSGGSVVGEALLVTQWSRHPSPNFHRGCQKVRNLTSFSTSFVFVPPAFKNAARYLNSVTYSLRRDDRPVSS